MSNVIRPGTYVVDLESGIVHYGAADVGRLSGGDGCHAELSESFDVVEARELVPTSLGGAPGVPCARCYPGPEALPGPPDPPSTAEHRPVG